MSESDSSGNKFFQAQKSGFLNSRSSTIRQMHEVVEDYDINLHSFKHVFRLL